MHRTIHFVACIAVLLFFMVVPLRAEDDDRNGKRFIKLDHHGQQLPMNAGQWTMVLDSKTGLVWEVKTEDGSIHDMQAGYDWKGAQETFIAELNRSQFGGFSDWRLPTTDELRTIRVNGPEPYINPEFFPNTVPSSYMSWRKCGSGEIFDERVKFGEIGNTKSNRQVRAVRGGNVEQVGENK